MDNNNNNNNNNKCLASTKDIHNNRLVLVQDFKDSKKICKKRWYRTRMVNPNHLRLRTKRRREQKTL
jgi:hypothetical protein